MSYKFATSEDINQSFIKSIYFDLLRPEVDEMQAFALERSSTFVIDKVSYFCDNDLQECKFYNENGQALFYDELHLTKEGLNLYGKKFVETLCKIDPLFCK